MKLSLTPKGAHPDLFELGESDIRVTRKRRPQFETRSRIKDLSATYSVRGPKRINRSDFIGKLIAFSILPALFLYHCLDTGWMLAVLAAISATPLVLVILSALRRPITRLTFIERGDGNFAFFIPYYVDEEKAVLAFAQEIQRRIRNKKSA